MKFLFLFFSLFLFGNRIGWLTDFEQAKKIATEKKEYILLNFSGSDWCGPCMRMQKEIFESNDFKDYSIDHLILLNADFPRNKKNKLSKELEKQNDQLAEKYNPNGKFPYTILMTAQGNVIKEWDGLPDLKPNEFVKQIMLSSENRK